MKHFHLSTRLVALMLALVMLFAMTACDRSAKPSDEDSSSVPSSSSGVPPFVNPLGDVDLSSIAKPEAPAPEVLEKLNAAYNLNNDVVGWLNVPNTSINNEVVQGTDNEFYLRRDTQKRDYFPGCFYADYECKFGDRNTLSKNTVIYGHNMGAMQIGTQDDPNEVMFAQLLKFSDQSFAEQNPIFYFSTPEDNMTFKVFSVMYTDTNLAYIHPNMTNTDFTKLISEMKDRSIYDYDVDVNASDKIFTMSTCTYKFGAAGTANYKQARFVVVGRLVRPGESVDSTAKLTVNADAKGPQFQ
ncbi:class B sortase [Anaerotruncus rubiinfantis]|uniref:class B sortase n=1 Tax=Anaerotruncus rubiinfantis TaxID=1720200 RepID=UPI0034A5A0E5